MLSGCITCSRSAGNRCWDGSWTGSGARVQWRCSGARWSRERVQGGSYPTIAGYLAALAMLPADLDVADEALQWCGRELERGFRTGTFSATAVARVFSRCDALALPGARVRADEVARALLAAQREDGSFPGEGPPERAACEAAIGLHHLGAHASPP